MIFAFSTKILMIQQLRLVPPMAHLKLVVAKIELVCLEWYLTLLKISVTTWRTDCIIEGMRNIVKEVWDWRGTNSRAAGTVWVCTCAREPRTCTCRLFLIGKALWGTCSWGACKFWANSEHAHAPKSPKKTEYLH